MGSSFNTGRIEAFSDGVFAVAATLLVVDLAVPAADFGNLGRGIVDQWPAYLGFATSFLTVGGIWLVHHLIFRHLRYADDVLIRLNLLLLMAVAFLPFPTSLVAEAIHSTDQERTAVFFYGATLLVISFLLTLIARYAGSHPDLIEEEGRAEVATAASESRPNVGLYLVVIGLGILLPKVAAFGFLAIAIFLIFRGRSPQPGEPGSGT